jgi:hypothetical protein
MGLGFPVLCQKNRSVRFEPDFGPIRLIFHKTNITRFGWFFKSKPNRTKPNREHP